MGENHLVNKPLNAKRNSWQTHHHESYSFPLTLKHKRILGFGWPYVPLKLHCYTNQKEKYIGINNLIDLMLLL